jgi:colanic acid/amylovoran biosynthesis glycosyltransferase
MTSHPNRRFHGTHERPPRLSLTHERFYHRRALYSAIRRVAALHLSACRNLTLVDLGCGDAPYKPVFADWVSRYISVDLPSNPRAEAAFSQEGRVDLPDSFADVVLSTQVLEHVKDPATYLDEAHRLLCDGGLLLISTHGYWMLHPDPTDYWRWTSHGLRVALENSGFRVLTTEGVMGLASAGVQLFQDGMLPRVPHPLRGPLVAVLQVLVLATDKLCSAEARNRDACVYVVAAKKYQREALLLAANVTERHAGSERRDGTGATGKPYGSLPPMGDDSRGSICVISPNPNAYSETFIRAHFERLPARVEALVGGYLPTHSGDGAPLFHQGLVARVARGIGRRVLRLASGYLETRAVVHFLKRRRITAVLCEYGPTGVMCYPACRTARVPLIVHFHGFDAYDRTTLDSFGRSYPQLFEAASAIVAVSRHMEQTLLELGAPRKKLHYNPYGVDTKVFRGAEPAAVPPRFLSVGRFVDKKAPHLTVLAFSLVAREVPEAQLTMIGGGPLMEASRQLARALRIGERVDFVGPQPPLDVAAAMRRSRAFVQHSVVTSYGDSEGTPVAILEAGASGLPVVATRHRGIADVVVDGTTGFLVDELDVDAMAERMLRLATDAQLADRLGRAGREHVASNYLVEDRIASLWQIISGTIAARR